MSNKKLRIILIIFLILNVTVLILMLLNKTKQNDKKAVLNNSVSNSYDDGKIKKEKTSQSINILYQNYNGEISKNNISEKIEIVVNQYFKLLYKNVIEKNSDASEYFNNNKESIKNRFGITNSEDFRNLINQLKKLNCSVENYESYEIKENSFTQEKDYTKCILIYNYKNKQQIEFDFYINNKRDSETINYIFIPKN